MPGMTASTSTADLRLRGSARVRVTWPPATAAAPALVVYLAASGDAEPCADTQAIVLAVHLSPGAAAFDEAREALEWAADHGAELGGDPRRLILAGSRRAAGLVAALARHARDRGWPPIERTVPVRTRQETR